MRTYYSAPFFVCLAVTKRCNLSCKHCCVEVDTDPDELTLEEIYGLLDQFKKAKIFTVQVFGGEPFLRKDIFQILRRLKEYRFSASINTNCTLINEKIVEEIQKVRPLGICTSLDGSTASIHDKMRGDGAFEKTVRGIKLLVKAGCTIVAEAVVTKFNIDDLLDIAELAKNIGLKEMIFVPVFYSGQAKCFQKELAPDDETYGKGTKIVKKLIEKYPGFARGAFIDAYHKIENFKTLRRQKHQRAAKIGLCGAGRTTAGIRSDGVVIPCSGIWDISCGSTRETPFMEIWRNSPVFKKFRELNKHSLDEIDECRNCEYKYFCNGNCRASALYYSGDLYGFDPDCNYFRESRL